MPPRHLTTGFGFSRRCSIYCEGPHRKSHSHSADPLQVRCPSWTRGGRHPCSRQTKNPPGQHALTQNRAQPGSRGQPERQGLPDPGESLGLRPESVQKANRKPQWDQDIERPQASSLMHPWDSHPHSCRLHRETVHQHWLPVWKRI
ncbi:hypothetical protein MC885_008496 [Smutsia gigantea]|nr:hypothetical protein MC885_008496 [Smutsia gigantea]